MTATIDTTLPYVYETPVSRAFAILQHRLSDLIHLEHGDIPHGSRETYAERTDHLATARLAVLSAAQNIVETPAEHVLDGPLHRLATLCELQITLDCPDERTDLYATVMDNFDLFEISGMSARNRQVRNIQRVFFTHYSELVAGGSMTAAVDPGIYHSGAPEAIPA